MSDVVRKFPVRKVNYVAKVEDIVANHKNALLVHADFVGSHQMQQIRISLRGRAVLLMGKNTMVRYVLRKAIENGRTEFEALLPLIKDNVGLVFHNDDAKQIRTIVSGNRVPAAAKAGVISPVDVHVPAGPTPLDPGQTSFFQSLNIPTKIARGCIEILSEVQLIKKGDKVGSSEVSLLNKLGIKPFSYGLELLQVFDDGSVYGPEMLDISNDDLLKMFFSAVQLIAALGLRIGYPTLATIPHSFATCFKNLVAISLATDYTFEQTKELKELLANPELLAARAAASAAPAASSGSSAAAAKAKEPEPEPEEEVDMGFSLFD